MSYIGRGLDKISNIEKLDTITFDGSSSYTLQKNSVNFTPNSANSLQVSIDGVVQAGNFTVSGSTIDFGVAIPATSTNDFIFHYGTGVAFTPADGTVGLAQLSATGTKDSTTFLRGDNTFAVPSGGVTNYFFAYDADTGGVNGDIILDQTEVNSGSNYSTSTGLYTAPSAGDYFFQVNFKRGGTGAGDLYFEKNGSQVSSTIMTYSGTSSTTATFSVILTLASSDTIGWYSAQNIAPQHCKFFGWRMS